MAVIEILEQTKVCMILPLTATMFQCRQSLVRGVHSAAMVAHESEGTRYCEKIEEK